MKTARYLALPAAVALHTVGAILISLLIWAVVARSTSPSTLAGGLAFLDYTLAATVGLLGVLGLALALRDRRAGHGAPPAQTIASGALAAALILQAARAFVPLGPIDRAIGFEAYNVLLQTLSTAGLLLAAVAVVAAVIASRRTPHGPGTVGRTLVDVVPPAALEGIGRRFMRHLATPLGLACMALVLPLLDVVQTGQGAWLPLVFAVALVIAVMVAALVALVGLIGVLVSARSGRYASRPAQYSAVATALVFVVAATFVPLQAAGASLVSVIATAILLLVALGSGLAAVPSARPTLRPAPHRPVAGTAVPATYHGRHDFSPRRPSG